MYTDKIYPDYDLYMRDDCIEIRTRVRKLYEGKYYFWDIIQRYEQENYSLIDFCHFIDKFIKDVYRIIVLGKINTNIIDSSGVLVFELDSNQQSEKERLIKLQKNEYTKNH